MSTVCTHCGLSHPAQEGCPQGPTLEIPKLSEQHSTSANNLAPSTLREGQVIGGYRLVKPIGSGGMGEVWEAVQSQILRHVAIKVLDDKFCQNGEVVVRFLREARAVNAIKHRNLVDIYAFGETETGRPYLVMELLQGKSLDALLQERGPLSLEEAVPIFVQICDAVEAAHQSHVIHRDLKPANIIVELQGTQPFVKILDFGIAKIKQEDSLTMTGQVLGTALYMSPEQCMGAKNVDHRTDVYALVTILFEMLTGAAPYRNKGDNRSAIWVQQIRAPIPDIAETLPNVPPAGLQALIAQGLAKSPDDRIASVQDLIARLLAVVGQGPTKQAIPAQAAHSIDLVTEADNHTTMRETALLSMHPNAANKSDVATPSTQQSIKEKAKAPILTHLVATPKPQVYLITISLFLLALIAIFLILTRSPRPSTTTQSVLGSSSVPVPREENQPRVLAEPTLPSTVAASAPTSVPALPKKTPPKIVPKPTTPKSSEEPGLDGTINPFASP